MSYLGGEWIWMVFFEAHQEYRQLFEARAEQQPGKALLKDTNPLMDAMWVLETTQDV